MYMDDLITWLYTRNQHGTVNQLYSNIKLKKKKPKQLRPEIKRFSSK